MDWRAAAERAGEILKDVGTLLLAAGVIGPSLTRLAGGQAVSGRGVLLGLVAGAVVAYVLSVVFHVVSRKGGPR